MVSAVFSLAIHLLLLAASAFWETIGGYSDCDSSELEVLMAIKSKFISTDELSSWDTRSNTSLFEGVTCNSEGKVESISLQGMNLSGQISPDLANLTSLRNLYLHFNALTGTIPEEITSLTQLTNLYLNVNMLQGFIPSEIGNMSSLQELNLCCNNLSGIIPSNLRSLNQLRLLRLQRNKLTGAIPSDLGNLTSLRTIDLSFNRLNGSIPKYIPYLPSLGVFYVQNNSLDGIIPHGFKNSEAKLGFQNNTQLCGEDIVVAGLRNCTMDDRVNFGLAEPYDPSANTISPQGSPTSTIFPPTCDRPHCSSQSKLSKIVFLAVLIAILAILACTGVVFLFRYYQQNEKIDDAYEDSYEDEEEKISVQHSKPIYPADGTTACWDPLGEAGNRDVFEDENLLKFMLNLEEIKHATQCFSNACLVRVSKFSSVYKGVLRDGSLVSIRSIGSSSCNCEVDEFVQGFSLLASLQHDNILRLRGFCISKEKAEFYIVHDFASNGELSDYFVANECEPTSTEARSTAAKLLDWPTRISIIKGIAKGIGYLHSNTPHKPPILHRRLSAEKILLDGEFKPLIADAGLYKLLANDIFFNDLKLSAALGHWPPEYVTDGLFTEKSNIYAFGVIILQIITGRKNYNATQYPTASASHKVAADQRLGGSTVGFSLLVDIALNCIQQQPMHRPTIESVIEQLESVADCDAA